MKRLFAIAVSSLVVLTGCSTGPEFGEVSSAIQDSQEMQADAEGQEELPEAKDNQDVVSESESSATDNQEEQPSQELVTFDLAQELVDDSLCKLEEQSWGSRNYSPYLAASFPPSKGITVDVIGSINIKVVFLEWEDLSGNQADYDFHVDLLEKAKDFYWVMSEGKLRLDYSYETSWNRVPGSYVDSYIPDDKSGGDWQSLSYLQEKIDKFVAASDPFVDFGDADVIFFAFPTAKVVVDGGGLHTFNFGNAIARTDEGEVGNLFSSGSRVYDHADEVQGWAVFAHEFGHTLGMPDLRDWSQGREPLGPNQYAMPIVNPMYGIDTMDNQDAGTQGISGWMKWLQGWLDDSQVICIEAGSVEAEYYRLDDANIMKAENKMLVIKLSATEALIVESKRWDKRFDMPMPHPRDGIVVYRLDAKRGHAEGPLRLLTPRDINEFLDQPNLWPDWRVLDVYLFEGDYVEMGGIRVTNVQSEREADTVLIEALG